MSKRKGVLVAALVAAGVLVAGYFGLPARSATAPLYATAMVTTADLRQTVLAVGRLRAKELVAVGAQVSGQVQHLHVALGQQVKAGDLIAEVDAQPQQVALSNARAALASLQAQLAAREAARLQAQQGYQREQMLLQGEATAQATYEAAKAALVTAQAEVRSLGAQIQQARLQVETARINLGYTRIVAPMDGMVVAVVTKQGQTLNAFQTTPNIVMLAKLDVMTVRAEISEADVHKIAPGQTVTFTTLGQPGVAHQAMVELVEPAPESIVNDVGAGASPGGNEGAATRAVYYNALFDVANPDGQLRPSMTVQVSILVDEALQALQVPNAALGARDADGLYSVRVRDAAGGVASRQVRIGLQTHSQTQVLEGLAPGEEVVLGEALPSDGPAGGLLGF